MKEFEENHLKDLENKLSEGKRPHEVAPFLRTLEEFCNHFLPLFQKIEDDISWLKIFKATKFDRLDAADELGLDLSTLKNHIRAVKKKLGIKERSPRSPKDKSYSE